MSLKSGAGIIDQIYDEEGRAHQIMLGLAGIADKYTADGLPYGYGSIALTHVVDYLKSILPSSVNISVQFPQWPEWDGTQMTGEFKVPYVAVKGSMGLQREVGIGRLLWEVDDAYVYAFNQTFYIEFSIWDRTVMKCDQIADQITLQLQMEKSCNGELFGRGFQNFVTVSSEPARAFRYGIPWDFKMLHQVAELFHTRLTVRTRFDVVWKDSSDINGTISQIVLSSTGDIPVSDVIGISLAYQRLEQLYWRWHGWSKPL